MGESIDSNVLRVVPKPAVAIVAIALVLLVANGCSEPASTSTPMPTPTTAAIIPTPASTPIATPTATLTPIPTPATPPTPQSRLEIALSWVPLEYADVFIEFADHAASRGSTGLEDVRGYEEYQKLDEQGRERFYEGVGNTHRDLQELAGFTPRKYGFDPWAFDLGVWAAMGNRPMPKFIVSEGGFDAATVRLKLETLGQQEEALAYQKVDYKGVTYFTRSEDYLFPRSDPPLVYSALNRVVVEEDRMMAAPATFILEDLIDVREGDAPNLLESEAHLSLAREVGDGLIGGGFLTQTWINETAIGHARGEYGVDPDVLDVYLEGTERWGTLSDYDLALFGYRDVGESRNTIIAIYYPEPDGAGKDAEELKKRWDSFHLHIDLIPVSDFCSPLSVRVVRKERASMLIGTCDVITTEKDTLFPHGPDLWLALTYTGTLEFLVDDLEAHKERVRERHTK